MPEYIRPFAFIFLRVSVSAILFLIFHSIFIREKLKSKRDILPLAICTITGTGANMLLFFKGLENTTPINGAILMTCTPIFVLVFAAFMLKETLSWDKIAGIVLACAGAVLLIGGENFAFNGSQLIGDLMVTINAIIYSYYLVYAKPLLKKYHPITLSKWTFLMGIPLTLPFGFLELQQINFAAYTNQIWFFLFYVVVGSTFLTYLLNSYALRHASPSLVGAYIYLQPVLATFIALALQKDVLTITKLLYMLLIFAGVFLAGRRKKVSTDELIINE